MNASENAGGGDDKPTRSRHSVWRILRGLFVLLGLGFVLLIFGSYHMRDKVRRILQHQLTASSSVVLSRAYPLVPGLNLKEALVERRLQRLGYLKVNRTPERPGQFFPGSEAWQIFLRESKHIPNSEQREQLAQLNLSPQGIVTNIKDLRFKEDIPRLWLEPEILSVLGNSSSRAVSTRRLEEFSPNLTKAVLAIEDDRFYSHFGVDPISILRAVFANVRSGKIVQGGSTITQQLAKNLFLSSERSLIRKVVEAFSAVLIETAFSKDQILEFYLNEVFLGQEGNVAIHGFGEAAQAFFAKDVNELSIAESALLAGIIKAPSSYSPRRYKERSLERQHVVLDRMAELEVISESERDHAKKQTINVLEGTRNRRVAPYFVDYVEKNLESILPDLSGENTGENQVQKLRVVTGVDWEFQECAESAVEKGLKSLEKDRAYLRKGKEPLQAALLAIIPSSGEVRAWVGGRDFGQNQFDRVSLAKRQPGSAFKPFVYLTALDEKLNSYRVARTTSLLVDEAVSYTIPGSATWEPQNYDKEFRGDVTVRYALAHSLNIPTIQLAMKVGIESVANTARLFGFGNNLPAVPSLALGAGEVTPFELAQAYAVLADGGIRKEIRPFIAVFKEDELEPIYETPYTQERVVDEAPVFVLTDMLQTVLDQGTGRVVRNLGFSLPAAGKTGTTNDARDSWFVGYTARILALVWVGFDDNRPIKLTGAQAAAPIWAEFMKCASKLEPQLSFVPPPGVIYKMVDRASGLLDVGNCPPSEVVQEIFVAGTEPVTPCPIHSPTDHFEAEDPFPRRDRNDPDSPDSGLPRAKQAPQRGSGSVWDRLFEW